MIQLQISIICISLILGFSLLGLILYFVLKNKDTKDKINKFILTYVIFLCIVSIIPLGLIFNQYEDSYIEETTIYSLNMYEEPNFALGMRIEDNCIYYIYNIYKNEQYTLQEVKVQGNAYVYEQPDIKEGKLIKIKDAGSNQYTLIFYVPQGTKIKEIQ